MRIPDNGGIRRDLLHPTPASRKRLLRSEIFSLLLRDDIREFLPCPFSAHRVLCTFRKYGLAPINEFVELLFIDPRPIVANEHIMIPSC